MPDGGGYDGSIRIRTKLDNSDIGAGLAELRAKLGALGDRIARMGSGKLAMGLGKQLETIKTRLTAIATDASGERLSRQYERATQDVERYCAELERLAAERSRYNQAAPETRNAAAYEKNLKESEVIANRLAAAEDRQAAAEAKLAQYTAMRGRKVEELTAAYERLNTQAGGTTTPTADTSGSEQTLSIWQRIGGAIKGAAAGIADFAKKTLAAASSSRRADSSTKSIGRNMSAAANSTRTFGAMLERTVKRILIFRLVHTVLQAIAERFKALMAANAGLARSVAQLKGSFLMAFQPLLDVAVPVLTTIFRIASKVFKVIAAIIAALFGRTVQQSAANSSALDQEAASLNNVGSAAKKASKSLANFDEINQLQNPDTGAGGGGGGSLTGGGTIIPEYDTSGLERVYEWLERIKNSQAFQRLQAVWDRFKQHTLETIAKLKAATIDWLHNTDFSPLANSFAGLMEKLEPLVELIEDGLYWAYTNVLLPIATWAVEDLAPTFLTLLGTALQTLYDVIVLLKPYAKDFYDTFLKPLGEWVAGEVITFLNDLNSTLGKFNELLEGKTTFREFIDNLSDTETVLLGIGVAVLGVVIAIKTLKTTITIFGALKVAIGALANPVVAVTVVIAVLIVTLLLLIKHWDKVKESAKQCWEEIKQKWQGAKEWMWEHVVQPVLRLFAGEFSGGLAGIFSNLFNHLIFNVVMAGLENLINNCIYFLNHFIDDINGILSIQIGGKSIGVQLPHFPRINLPRLAQGAVIPPNAPFLAMLGDQTHGTNIEAPLDTLVAAFKAAQKEQQPQTVNVVFKGSLAQLGQVLRPVIEAEDRRIGASFAKA